MDHTGIGLRDDESDDVATLAGYEAFERCHDVDEGLEDPAAYAGRQQDDSSAFSPAGRRRYGTGMPGLRLSRQRRVTDGTQLLTEATVVRRPRLTPKPSPTARCRARPATALASGPAGSPPTCRGR